MGDNLIPYQERAVAPGQGVTLGFVAAVSFLVWLLSWSPLLIAGGAGFAAWMRFKKALGG